MSAYFFIFKHLLIIVAGGLMLYFLFLRVKTHDNSGDSIIKPLSVFLGLFLYFGIRNAFYPLSLYILGLMRHGGTGDVVFVGYVFPIVFGCMITFLLLLPSLPNRPLAERILLMANTLFIALYIDTYIATFSNDSERVLIPNLSFALCFIMILVFMMGGRRSGRDSRKRNEDSESYAYDQ